MTISERFNKFHVENPSVYNWFKHFANVALARGYKHYSAKAIFERVRWEIDLSTTYNQFKLNNDYTSRYARLLAMNDNRFIGFFRNRVLKSKN